VLTTTTIGTFLREFSPARGRGAKRSSVHGEHGHSSRTSGLFDDHHVLRFDRTQRSARLHWFRTPRSIAWTIPEASANLAKLT
jgi:hypothetical protein